MRVLVIGGSGLIGSRVVARLRQGAHDVIAASPSTGVNTVTGDGLPEAMEATDAVVDVANSPSFEDAVAWDFFFKAGNNVAAAEKAAGVKHHVALSVVGTEQLQDSGYFRAKALQEQIIQKAGVPYTILRATQFFEFLNGVAGFSTGKDRVVRLPPALMQPVAADDVGETLARLVVGAPVNGRVELAGPQAYRLNDVVGRVLAAAHDERLVVADPTAKYFGVAIGERTLVPAGDHPLVGAVTLDDWLARGQSQAA